MRVKPEPQVGIEPTTARTSPRVDGHFPYIDVGGQLDGGPGPNSPQIGHLNHDANATQFVRGVLLVDPLERTAGVALSRHRQRVGGVL